MSEVATKMRMKADLEKGDVIIQCSPRASAAKGGDDDGKSVGKEEREESCRSTNAQNMGKRDEEQVDPDNSFYDPLLNMPPSEDTQVAWESSLALVIGCILCLYVRVQIFYIVFIECKSL